MDRFELPVEDILEALDLTRAQPGIGFLQALFARFNARVPFETASKIVRNAEVSDPSEKPRWPAIFWREHLEEGAGGTCFARVAAFAALLEQLGFTARKVFGRVERDLDHAALLVSHGGRIWICDVGFPLPELLPAEAGEVETPLGELSVAVTQRGFRIDFSSGVPEGPRSLEIFEKPVSEETFCDQWRETFRPDSRFLSAVALRRQEPSRVVSFSRGELKVDDRHSRLTVPVTERRVERLSDAFQIGPGLLERAFALSGDSPPQSSTSFLTAYLEVAAEPQKAFEAIAGPSAYRRLLEGVAVVETEEETASGWRFQLAASPAGKSENASQASLWEDCDWDPVRLVLRVRRTGSPSRGQPELLSEFRVEERAGRTFLVREALFDSPREDLLRNDSLRGRLAGSLAVDLLAWTRLI